MIAGPAHAAKAPPARVVVAPFDGPAELASQARRIVIQVVADRYELIPGKRFAAARRSGASGTPGIEEIVEVAARIDVDAVVIGQVTKRGRRYRLRIAVHMGADGHEIESVVLTLRRPVVEGADRTAVERQAEGVMAAFADSWKARAAVRSRSRTKPRSRSRDGGRAGGQSGGRAGGRDGGRAGGRSGGAAGERGRTTASDRPRVTRKDKEGTLNPFGPGDVPPPERPSRAERARRQAAQRQAARRQAAQRQAAQRERERTAARETTVRETTTREAAADADSSAALMAPDATDIDDPGAAREATAATASAPGGARPADSGSGDAVEPPSRALSWARGAVTAGGSFVGRQLLFAVDDDIAQAMAPTEFENRGASGIVVSAELHPLSALGKLPGELGLTFVFDRTIGVKTDFNGQKFDTVQERMGVGLQAVHDIDQIRDGFAVVAAAGYNRLRHNIDSGNTDIGIPDVDYVYLDVGVGVRTPVVSVLSVFAEGRYIQVLSAGELEEQQNYGGTDASGMDLDAGVDIAVIAGVGVRAGIKYIRVEAAFDGTGALTQLDADEDADVAGATDTYFGGYLTMGYRF